MQSQDRGLTNKPLQRPSPRLKFERLYFEPPANVVPRAGCGYANLFSDGSVNFGCRRRHCDAGARIVFSLGVQEVACENELVYRPFYHPKDATLEFTPGVVVVWQPLKNWLQRQGSNLHNSPKTKEKSRGDAQRDAQKLVPHGHDLTRVVTAWSKLSLPLKAAILAIVDSSATSKEDAR